MILPLNLYAMIKFLRQMGGVMLVLIIVLAPIMPVYAQDTAEDPDSIITQKLDLASDFFATAFDADNFLAPFDDLFDQNACKRRDIFALIKKRDAIGSIIRKGILDTDVSVETIRGYQRNWELTSAEIYFLRHIDLMETDETVRLASETRELYPSNPLINDAIPKWVTVYTGKLSEYQNCQPTWGAIAARWDKLKIDIAKAGSNISQAWTDLSNEAATTFSAKSLEDIYDSVIATKDKLFAGNFSDYVKIDYGPYSTFAEATAQKRRKAKIQADAVASELMRDPNANIIDLTRRSVNKSGTQALEFMDDLAQLNETLAYNYADEVINSLWDEAQVTNQRMASLSDLADAPNATSLTYNLNTLNSLQCRERE
ncbi:hypothetical protein CO045_01990 [Candidatus Peregrinibacteria bacterium CG_4_9_14_0_2_um_filter_41_14]|nr:MAG: hypothetical protein CO045_01990 [Candidatus Peregrinibacteria bacterium CG_4_9_14_0_2_um_filter_41_14]